MTREFRLPEEEVRGVYRAIFERRDIRNYRPDPIPADVLTRILTAAHHAPSVGFMQPWSFVLVEDRAIRERVYAHFREVNERAAEVWNDDRKRAYQALKLQGILDAPMNLLVTCDPSRAGEHSIGDLAGYPGGTDIARPGDFLLRTWGDERTRFAAGPDVLGEVS